MPFSSFHLETLTGLPRIHAVKQQFSNGLLTRQEKHLVTHPE
jgi:hypothetical protein